MGVTEAFSTYHFYIKQLWLPDHSSKLWQFKPETLDLTLGGYQFFTYSLQIVILVFFAMC